MPLRWSRMTERELIAQVLQKRPGAERALKYLASEIHDATEGLGEAEGDPVGYVVRAFDRLRADFRDESGPVMPSGGAPYSRTFEYIDGRERERWEARAEVVAKHAASDEEVRVFRDRFLGGRLLTPEEAQEFVTSLANQNLPTRWFDEHRVPFSGHAIQARSETNDFRGEILEFTVRPPGVDCRIEKRALTEDYGGGRMLVVAGDPPDVAERRRNDIPLPAAEEGRDLIAHDGLPDLGYWRGFTGYVRTDSPLGALRTLGDRLTKRYRTWKCNQATRFVLTGEPPEGRSPLWTETGTGGEIIVHAEPWISPESVKNAYMRSTWLRGWASERYTVSGAKRQRGPQEKSLKLLRFVTASMDRIDDPSERRTKGREIAARWDVMHPPWAYRGDTRTMWRDFNRALNSVAPAIARQHRPPFS